MSLKDSPTILDDIDSELAVQRLVQACMREQLHVTNPRFLKIISIHDPHECFCELCGLIEVKRLNVQKIIQSENGELQ